MLIIKNVSHTCVLVCVGMTRLLSVVYYWHMYLLLSYRN